MPATALGYKSIYDYRSDQLGVKGNFQGFLLIEGACSDNRRRPYCPNIPEALVNATADYRQHKIDEATYRARLEGAMELPGPSGRAALTPRVTSASHCPAAGSWPAARCELQTSLHPEGDDRPHPHHAAVRHQLQPATVMHPTERDPSP